MMKSSIKMDWGFQVDYYLALTINQTYRMFNIRRNLFFYALQHV